MSLPFRTRSRRALLRPLAVAMLALALAAPAALAVPADYPPPNYPSAVPERPGAITDERGTSSLAGTTSDDGRSSDTAAALAQERSYASYGTPTPLTPPSSTVETAGDDGIAPLPFVLSLLGALIVGIAATSAAYVVHGRRTRPAGIP